MASKNRTLFLGLLLLAHGALGAPIPNMPELLTKQDVANINFLSSDGKFTYYQNRSGALVLSTNFSAKEIFQGQTGAQYSFVSGPVRSRLLVSVHRNHFSSNSLMAPQTIGLMNYGGEIVEVRGEGLSPRLHVKETWMSFYGPQEKMLIFQSTEKKDVSFQLPIENNVSPYFIPEVIMLSDKEILFTDIVADGSTVLKRYDRPANATQVLTKTALKGVKMELCLGPEKLFIGQFGSFDVKHGSIIQMVDPLHVMELKTYQILYDSPTNDIGHILCSTSATQIYFVQNQTPKTSKYRTHTELVTLEVATKKVTTLSNLGTVGQVMSMDGNVLIPFQGTYYVVSGKNDHSQEILSPGDVNLPAKVPGEKNKVRKK